MTTRQPTTNDDYGGGKWPSSIYLFKQQEQKQKRNMKKEKIINWTFISLRIYCDKHQNGGKGGYKEVERASERAVVVVAAADAAVTSAHACYYCCQIEKHK